MSFIRIAVVQLSGRLTALPAVSIQQTLAKAHAADVVVLDLFSSHSVAPAVLTALANLRRPVRVVGASTHWKRVLKISRLDRKFHIIEQTTPLCPPPRSPGLQYVELHLGD